MKTSVLYLQICKINQQYQKLVAFGRVDSENTGAGWFPLHALLEAFFIEDNDANI